jgi:hypothetical protein
LRQRVNLSISLKPKHCKNGITTTVEVVLDAAMRSFALNYKPPHPKTGARVDVPRKYMPHFKAMKKAKGANAQRQLTLTIKPWQQLRQRANKRPIKQSDL